MDNVLVRLVEFGDLIDRYTSDFVGREWLVNQVESRLAEDRCRFLVLTGGPGVGKSAFMARLAATHPDWLRYFIRRDSRDLLRPGDGKTFFLTIGGQLATLRRELFKPEKLEFVIRQRVGTLEETGQVTGALVRELTASPFYSVSIEVDQEIERVKGRQVALEIGRLVTEPRQLSLQDLQFMGLLAPAWLLHETDPAARIVVLVDALDELRFSPAEVDILEALCGLPVASPDDPAPSTPEGRFRLPPNLRFLLTSRPEKFLDRLLARRDAAEFPLAGDGDARGDLEAYARAYSLAYLPEAGLRPAFERRQMTRDGLIDDLVEKAAGNFLYLRSVLAAIREALEDPAKAARLPGLLAVKELPADLDALYDYFLDTLVGWIERQGFGESAWRACLRPLLGVLAVARAPLDEARLRAFTALSPEDLGDLLRELRQFIEPLEGGRAFRLYHASFAEYLLDAHSNRDYRIDAPGMHRRIVHAYAGPGLDWRSLDWEALDSYAVAHLVAHAAAAGELRGVHQVYCKEYLNRKRLVYSSEIPLMEEAVELVLPRAAPEELLEVAYSVLYDLRPNSYRAVRTLAAAAGKIRALPDLRRRLAGAEQPLARILSLLSGPGASRVRDWRSLEAQLQESPGRAVKQRRRDLALLFLAFGMSGLPALQRDLMDALSEYTSPEVALSPSMHQLAWYAAEGLRELGLERLEEQTLMDLEARLAPGNTALARSTALYVLSRLGCRTDPVREAIRAGLLEKRSSRLAGIAADAARLLKGLLPDEQAVSGLESLLGRGARPDQLVIYVSKDPWNYPRRRALRALVDFAPPDESLLDRLEAARIQLETAPPDDADAPGISRLVAHAVRRIRASLTGQG